MAGFKTFAVGEVLTAADVNSFLMSQTVMVFADAAARSTALGANVTEGMLSYLLDAQRVEVYDGVAWVELVPPPPALDDLTDVDATAPNDGDVLIYDNGTGDWTATAQTSITGITSTGALNAGSISSGFGNINIGTSTFTGNGSGLTNLNGANISSGKIPQARLWMKRVARFTGTSTWVVPAGVTYAIAHVLGGGGGVGEQASAVAGGFSRVAFGGSVGNVDSNGGSRGSTSAGGGTPRLLNAQGGQANSGRGATAADNTTFGVMNPNAAQWVVAGSPVTPGASIAVTVGNGGAAGTSGAAGGSGYVYIEYYE